MNAEFDRFLAPFMPVVQAVARRVRSLVLAVMPDAIEQLDPSARLIAYGFDRTYRGLVCGIALQRGYVNLMFARGGRAARPGGLIDRRRQARPARQDPAAR